MSLRASSGRERPRRHSAVEVDELLQPNSALLPRHRADARRCGASNPTSDVGLAFHCSQWRLRCRSVSAAAGRRPPEAGVLLWRSRPPTSLPLDRLRRSARTAAGPQTVADRSYINIPATGSASRPWEQLHGPRRGTFSVGRPTNSDGHLHFPPAGSSAPSQRAPRQPRNHMSAIMFYICSARSVAAYCGAGRALPH